MTQPSWFNLEAERYDISYRTGIKVTPEEWQKALMREQAQAAYPMIARLQWGKK